VTTLLTGKEPATALREATATKAAALSAADVQPCLAVVTATDDEGSAWYVRSIAKAATKVGITCNVCDLGPTAAPDMIRAALGELSIDDTVHGIILQTPLPAGAALKDLAGAIDPAKDVDGANPVSLGRLAAGLPAFAPATAEAVLVILDHYGIELTGRNAVVVGRSLVVGKPLAHLLLDRNATVTVAHSRSRDLPSTTRQADVLVAAAGRAGLITPEYVGAETTVIDVGTNPTDDGGLVGDADAAIVDHVAAITPVPGGVGPVTTALLLAHTVAAASARRPAR
jgi:methylenetetrahydrofolate dehydrogenase (NADP+)/methenyltetrahydrofolate cyclohydrolase